MKLSSVSGFLKRMYVSGCVIKHFSLPRTRSWALRPCGRSLIRRSSFASSHSWLRDVVVRPDVLVKVDEMSSVKMLSNHVNGVG